MELERRLRVEARTLPTVDAYFTSMSIHRLHSRNCTQQSTRQRRRLRLTLKRRKEPCGICLQERSCGATRFTSGANTTSNVNDFMSSIGTKAVATKAQRRQRQPRTANIGRGVGPTIGRRRDSGIKPGSNGSTEKGTLIKALTDLEDDGLDDEIVFDSAEGSPEP